MGFGQSQVELSSQNFRSQLSGASIKNRYLKRWLKLEIKQNTARINLQQTRATVWPKGSITNSLFLYQKPKHITIKKHQQSQEGPSLECEPIKVSEWKTSFGDSFERIEVVLVETCVIASPREPHREGHFKIGIGASKLKKLRAVLDCSTSRLDEFYSDPHSVSC